LTVDKATESSTIYCPVNRVHADITDYHKILTGIICNSVLYMITANQLFLIARLLKQSDQYSTNVVSQAQTKPEEDQFDQNSFLSKYWCKTFCSC